MKRSISNGAACAKAQQESADKTGPTTWPDAMQRFQPLRCAYSGGCFDLRTIMFADCRVHKFCLLKRRMEPESMDRFGWNVIEPFDGILNGHHET